MDGPVKQARWLAWARKLQAISQAGLTYAKDPYDLERYGQLRAMAVEMVAEHVGASPEDVAAAFALGSGYPTPKVDVRAVVFRDGQILLVRERSVGRWSLPGGWADVGESLREVAARETLEETGYRVHPSKLLAVLDKARHGHPPSLDYVYKVFVGCQLQGGTARTSLETDAVGFFDEDSLPELETHRVTSAQITRMFQHHADASLPADFD
jgi:ADP-ribose pyrophosphatase YjhB (NUDIX family)